MRWAGADVVVAGMGVSGTAAADALLGCGARVTVVDAGSDQAVRERAEALESRGARVLLGPEASASLPGRPALVIASPGWPPSVPLLAQARSRDVEIWSEVELAWRLRGGDAAPWLCVTGTNGKTTTVQMLASMLARAGLRATAVGNVGTPVTQVVVGPQTYDVLAVELSSFQLHWTSSLAAEAAVLLNVAPDHLDWYAGSLSSYTADKARVYRNAGRAAVYNVDDPVTEQLVRAADVAPGCRILGFTLGEPAAGEFGVIDGALAERTVSGHVVELAAVDDVVPAAPHNLANALAAAALARAQDAAPEAVAAGLRAFRLDAHRIAKVAAVAGVDYVDDSKATNPHAALASLLSFEHVVWIAGGLAKGADFGPLVEAARHRLVGVVLLGADERLIADALARHAPDVPVVTVTDSETGTVMDRVVDAAARLSRPGDTVLLAPGCASQDMFADYGARGAAFSAAVRRMRR